MATCHCHWQKYFSSSLSESGSSFLHVAHIFSGHLHIPFIPPSLPDNCLSSDSTVHSIGVLQSACRLIQSVSRVRKPLRLLITITWHLWNDANFCTFTRIQDIKQKILGRVWNYRYGLDSELVVHSNLCKHTSKTVHNINYTFILAKLNDSAYFQGTRWFWNSTT